MSEHKNLVIKLTDYIFTRFKKEGKIQRILEYNYTVEEEDIYNDIALSVIEFLKSLDYKLLPGNGKNEQTLYYSAYKHSMKVFTNYVQKGSNQISRIVKIKDGYKIITDREFQQVKRRYNNLNSTSKRNTRSINDFDYDDSDKRDFFEKRPIEASLTYTPSFYPSEYDEHEDKELKDQIETLKLLNILEKLCK